MRDHDPHEVAAVGNSFVATRAGYHKTYRRADIVLHARWDLSQDQPAVRIV